mmetsp:Transcript_63902/g.142738  ORF Transcript_63902/g.142738 Transcript_63902/m.142738 type:complete len:134 (-) Transcript_63902:1196-1597(-)
MGILFTAMTYISGYIFLIFVAVCLACGLYYLAELAEEHTSLTKKMMWVADVAVLITHALFFVFEELPPLALGVGFISHILYLVLLRGFPFLRLLSPTFLLSFGALRTPPPISNASCLPACCMAVRFFGYVQVS